MEETYVTEEDSLIYMVIAALILIAITITIILAPFVEAQEISDCGFYIENGTCEEMAGLCGTQVTALVKSLNYGLQEELEICEEKLEKDRFNKPITIISVLLAVILLWLRTKEWIKRKKVN